MKRHIIYFLLLLMGVPSVAKDYFTELDWRELKIDSVLPVYTEVVPLETDYRNFTYTVELEYPEYGELSSAEREAVLPFKEIIGERISVDTHVGVQRGKGMLDLSFVPLVQVGGKYRKLLSCRIMITAHPKKLLKKASGNRTARYADHSVLREGNWVKIAIEKDGVYSLTRNSLKKMGFPNPEKVRLYGYGGHRQNEAINPDEDYDDLVEVPLFQKDANTWLFWGNGLVFWDGNTRIQNHYANEACYFLSESDAPSVLDTVPSVKSAKPKVVNSFTDHVLYEKDEFAWHSVGRNLYENVNFAGSSVRTYKLQTENSLGDESLTIAFTAAADAETTLQPSVNGKSLTPAMTLSPIGTYIYATSATKTFDVSKLKSEDNTWNVKLASTSGHDARLDYLALHYSRLLATPCSDGYCAFQGEDSGDVEYQIVGNPDNTLVLRIGSCEEKTALMQTEVKGDATLGFTVRNSQSRYVAIDLSHSFPEPAWMGKVENQDLHALDSLDMVIIVPASGKLMQQAQRLADAHLQYDNMKVGVVRADQVYNEFSSGTPDATAYRRFVKMLYDRGTSSGTAPRYLLLMGDCAWDNRMQSTAWRMFNPDDYLLCYESENSVSDTKSYVMEDYFGLMDDGEGGSLLKDKSDLGIGRFPVTSAAEAKILVDKSILHMSNRYAGPWKNLVCFLGDDGDENEHMKYADDVAERVIAQNPEIEVKKIMWDTYKRVSTAKNNTYPEVTTLLKKYMNDGALVMNYTGHATTYTLSHEFVLNVEDFAATRGTNLPLWITASCDVMPFDGQSTNIGETAVLNPSGGAVAFYGTTRTVYASQNLAMNRNFMKYLFSVDEKGQRRRVGDAIRLAKNAIISGGQEYSLQENKLQYALLGDPALIIAPPTQHIEVDSINGVAPEEGEDIVLKAGGRVTVAGHVSDASGSVIPAFQGILTSRLYDNEESITCLNNAGAKNAFSYMDRRNVLYHSQDSVRNGRFSLSFTVPVDINFSDLSGRLVFYAVNEDKTLEANGFTEAFSIGGVSEELETDTVGPDIFALLNDEDFQDGDEVNSTPFFVARLHDESGISASGNGIGHDLMLCVDGRADYTFNLNEGYVADFGDNTWGTVTYSIPTLEAGPHSLEFRAWDVLNNHSSTTLSFVVNPSLRPDLVQIAARPNPAVSTTNFILSYNRPGSECTFTIDVFDFAGRRLWSHTETGSSASGVYAIPWNLSTGSGGRLGSGVYLYRCTLQCGESKQVTESQKIIVLNNK